MNKKSGMKKGFSDGLPIGIGYLSVSIGIGITAVSSGLSILNSVIMSMSCLTSAGQAAGISVIAALGTLLEMALIQLVINLRYSLMGISMSQKLDESVTTKHRLILGAFITDEIFAVSSTKDSLNTRYLYGLIIAPYFGWALGTLFGATLGTVLPESVNQALGLAIYGMFVAIVVPVMKKSKEISLCVLLATLISIIIRYVPIFSFISYGFTIIISAVISASVFALYSLRREKK